MRHGKSGRKFNMNPDRRIAVMRSMVTALLRYEQIRTTAGKAREVRRIAERTITWGTRLGDLLTKEHGDLSVDEKARLVHAKRMARRSLGVNPTWKSAEERAELKEDARNGEGLDRAQARDSLDVVDWLFTEIAPRFVGRPGGYTRLLREAKARPGDAAPMAVIQLLPAEAGAAPAKPAGKGAGKAAKAPKAEAKSAEPKAKKAKAKGEAADKPAEKGKKAKKKSE